MKGMDFGRFSATNKRTGKSANTATSPGMPGINRSGNRFRWVIVMILIAGLLLTGAGALLGQARNSPDMDSAVEVPSLRPAAAPTTTAAAALDYSMQTQSNALGTSQDNAQAAKSAPSSSGASSSGTSGGNASQMAQAWDRMLIRTAALQLTVTNVGAGVDAALNLAAAHGGRVLQMNSQQSGDYSVSTLVLEVPSAEFDKIIPELHKLNGQVKKVQSETIGSQDVTDQYTDLQSQLRNLQATESRMLALQQKADTLQDILTIDQQLRDVQGQIEQVTGRINYLSKSSDMSQITVTLSPEAAEPVSPTATSQPVWDPGVIAAQAWNSSLDLLSKLATVLITVGVFLWWTLPLLLIGWWLSRRLSRRPAATIPATNSGDSSAT